MFFSKQTPDQVFTPRAADVNADMYVTRVELERALKDGLRGNLHLVLHGDSGSGKSWLYKNYLAQNKVPYVIANLANASRLGSIAAELQNLVDRRIKPVKIGYEEEKKAGVDMVVSAGVSHKDLYEYGKMEPFEACLADLHAAAGKGPSVLVFDNLEAAFKEPLLEELANLIILCDDDRYAFYQVKILIVGVPRGVREYYYRTPHHKTVVNRLGELPPVARLTSDECDTLVRRGFIEKLAYEVFDLDRLQKHVEWVTHRMPQMIHEYCLELSVIGENYRIVTEDMLAIADYRWVTKRMTHGYAMIEQHMNERDTKAGRRNQTLYVLAVMDKDQFKATEVEAVLRQEFPKSTYATTLNVAQIMAQLAAGDRRLVKRSAKGDAFEFDDPSYRMVLRTMLRKTLDERVEKVPAI